MIILRAFKGPEVISGFLGSFRSLTNWELLERKCNIMDDYPSLLPCFFWTALAVDKYFIFRNQYTELGILIDNILVMMKRTHWQHQGWVLGLGHQKLQWGRQLGLLWMSQQGWRAERKKLQQPWRFVLAWWLHTNFMWEMRNEFAWTPKT